MLAPDPRFAIIDGLTGKEFELALVELFEALGYDDVERIGGFDKGADLTFVDNGERVAVQAKRSSSAGSGRSVSLWTASDGTSAPAASW